MPIVGAIIGATGVGKTELSVAVAQNLHAQIVCMDSRQVFQGFRIGTAQPTPAERGRVAHHLVDFLAPGESYSAGRFAADVRALCDQFPHTRFLLVGGTGMYLQTLTEGMSEVPPADPAVREALRAQYAQEPPDVLYANALAADPGIREKIMPGDTQRLLRVLEVQAQGAGRWSDYLGRRSGGVGPVPTVWLDRDREILYRRINVRVAQMFLDGWADEVRELSLSVPPDAPAWQSLGYREIRSALEAGTPLDYLLETLRQQTRHYAKRQLTWFRHHGFNSRLDLDQISPAQCLQEMTDIFCR